MPNDAAVLDAVVVGAGQAGLGISYYLARAGVRHRVLERDRIGESWRTQRWDAFRMNTINAQTVLPGQRYEGPEPEGFMTQHDWVGLLEEFAVRNRLPVDLYRPATELSPHDGSSRTFRLATPRGEVLARSVVIASGAHIRPRLPRSAGSTLADLTQIHSADYRNPAALLDGAVLVVGAGQSGCQIAEDLLSAGRTVYFSTCRAGRSPRRYRDATPWFGRTRAASQICARRTSRTAPSLLAESRNSRRATPSASNT